MASLRDAHKRLEIIFRETAPDQKEADAAEASLDEFTRLKKKVHQDMKQIRQALRERESANKTGGTTTETAEASYRIRVMIKTAKESISRMQEIYDKESKKKKIKDPAKVTRVAEHKEVMELVKSHLDEVEGLEKRKQTDAYNTDRSDLLGRGGSGDPSYLINTKSANDGPVDPFASELPDIDAENDMKEMKERDKQIDQDVNQIGEGVKRLRDIAIDMGQELEKQDADITRITAKTDAVTDHVDNVNITMKKTLDGVMKGDKFMVNCVLLCVILALVAFISSQFLNK